jgi:hypothetical protein
MADEDLGQENMRMMEEIADLIDLGKTPEEIKQILISDGFKDDGLEEIIAFSLDKDIIEEAAKIQQDEAAKEVINEPLYEIEGEPSYEVKQEIQEPELDKELAEYEEEKFEEDIEEERKEAEREEKEKIEKELQTIIEEEEKEKKEKEEEEKRLRDEAIE